MNSFYFDKMHMLYNQNKSCVKSCKKHCFFKKTLFFQKTHCFTQKNHCFPTCALFYPIVLKRKIITAYNWLLTSRARNSKYSCAICSSSRGGCSHTGQHQLRTCFSRIATSKFCFTQPVHMLHTHVPSFEIWWGNKSLYTVLHSLLFFNPQKSREQKKYIILYLHSLIIF